MAGLKSLLKDTAVYGISSIVGRLLNWLLVPMYTYVFTRTGEYGIVTNLYSYVAVALIVLTYGMETGFFRFTNHERWDNPQQVYTTSMMTVGSTSVIFAIAAWLAAPSLSRLLDYGQHPEYIRMMAVAVAADAFTSIPFAYLRYRKRPYRFAALKLIGIGLNILLNIFFIIICPWLWRTAPQTISWFYDPTFGIGYIFLANVICSLATLLLLIPELRGLRWSFNTTLLREMLRYSLPLLVLGLAGIMNQTVDKILLPILESDKAQAMSELGIYGACYKVAVIMVMFLQAFRFAYEPFVFAKNREAGTDKMQTYSSVMTWFVAFGFLIFLGVMEFLPVIRYIISPTYFQGLKVVPVIMLAELFFGVFFNLSIWYKLTDRTAWGSWFSLGGLAITLTLNILLVPHIGYMGCAWAALACYSAMMVASYLIGRNKFPVPYRLGRIATYAAAGILLWLAGDIVKPGSLIPDLAIGTIIIIIYIALIYILEIQNARKSATTA